MSQLRTLGFFEAVIQTTQEWMVELTELTGRADEHKAWQMLRAVLHVLRDRMTVAHSAHLSAQLPTIIRGLYFEGWRPAEQPLRLRTRAEFITAVSDELSGHPEIDPNQAVACVFRLLAHRITGGELDKIKQSLQPELRAMWPTA